MFKFNRRQKFFRRFVLAICASLAMSAAAFAEDEEEKPLKRIDGDKEIKELYKSMTSTTIDFDKDTRGRAVVDRSNLDDLFLTKGVAFSDDAKVSHVAAYRYNVGGRSGDRSAGMNKPPYTGVVRITFHDPDDPDKKATVTKFGMYLSAVKPDGTTVEAYDIDDKLIGSLSTERGNTDFIGAESDKKIHYLRIVANEMIDPDFAFDDLVFDAPKQCED